MDSPGAPSSSRLSPFKTYREFVADQRDDADPQAFARRYGEYRGGFARELVRRFFERNADFAWFRDRYDPSRVEERCEKQRARRGRGQEVPRGRRQGGRGRGQAGVARPERD